jgi:hypothetical protein
MNKKGVQPSSFFCTFYSASTDHNMFLLTPNPTTEGSPLLQSQEGTGKSKLIGVVREESKKTQSWGNCDG